MVFKQLDSNLTIIDLDQEMTGFRKFISAWLYRDAQTTFLVDPGPSHSIAKLIETLERLKVKTIDFILLTHIHIDHAGGTGRLLDLFPEARVVCHEKGIEHMIDPEKLWQGSLKVLGKIAQGYGEIIPVPRQNIGYMDEIETASGTIRVVQTPGHAVHHLSYLFKDYLFAGEVAGVRHQTDGSLYARPATPPIFKLGVSLASLDKVIELDFEKICFGHYGYYTNPKPILTEAREQLKLWVTTVETELKKQEDDPMEKIIAKLKEKDELFQGVDTLETDIRQREDYFVKNSIKGMISYVKDAADR